MRVLPAPGYLRTGFMAKGARGMDLSAISSHLRGALPDLLAVYVFGSEAAGVAGPDSDLDIAVLVETSRDPAALWRLSGELSDIAGRHVDLVDLRKASTVMQSQIVGTGRRLWARDFNAGVYEAFIFNEKLELDAARAPLIADIEREGRVHGR